MIRGRQPHLVGHVAPDISGVKIRVGLLLLGGHISVKNRGLHSVMELEYAPNQGHIGAIAASAGAVVVLVRVGQENRCDGDGRHKGCDERSESQGM